MATIPRNRQIHKRLLIGRPDGQTWEDVADYLSSIEIELGSIEQLGTGTGTDIGVRSATFELRNVPGERFAPRDRTSPWNQLNGEWAPLLWPYREVVFQTAVTAPGASPALQDWITIFEGYMGDSIVTESHKITVSLRDKSKLLQDTYIDVKKTYEGPIYAENLIQAIINDYITDAPPSLFCPVPSEITFEEMTVEYVSVWDAIQNVAKQIGWYLGYRWNGMQYVLAFIEPPRDKTTYDFELDWEDVILNESLDIGDSEIRNALTITFKDASTGEPVTLRYTDYPQLQNEASISEYRLRAMEITEKETSLIDSEDKALRFGELCIWDLSELSATNKITLPYMPEVDVFSTLRVTNPLVSSTSDFYAVQSVRHTLRFGDRPSFRTEVIATGRVVGARKRWLDMETRPGRPGHPSNQGPPGPPGEVQVPKPATPVWSDYTLTNTLHLRWRKAEFASGYEIRTDQNWGELEGMIFRGYAHSFSFIPIERDMILYLKALNAIGEYSDNYATLEVSLPAPPPPQQPEVEAFFSALKIHPTPLNNPAVMGYYVYVTGDGIDDKIAIIAGDSLTYPLPSGTTVTIQVSAYDVIGEGGKSQPLQATTTALTDGDIPDDIVGPSKLTEDLRSDIDLSKTRSAEAISLVEGYTNKVGELETSIEGITGRVSNTETNIDNLTGEVESVKTDVSQLEIRADGIESTVTSLDAKVDGIEVGGRNLLVEGEMEWGYLSSSTGELTPAAVNGFNRTTGYIDVSNISTITLSQYDKIDDFDGRGRVVGYDEDKNFVGVIYNDVDTASGWNKPKSITLNVSDVYYIRATLIWWGRNRYKLEKGNKATDWTPAPEDVEAEINTVSSQVTQLANEITLKVQKRTSDGKLVVTGMGVAIDEDGQSEVAVLADRFRILGDVEGESQPVFAVDTQTQKIYILGDLIAEGLIRATEVQAEVAKALLMQAELGVFDEIHGLRIRADKITVGGTRNSGLPITKPRGGKLWHFDTSLHSTDGIKPLDGSVATLRPNEGRFGGAVAVEEGTTNLCDPAYRYTNTWTTIDYGWSRLTTINCTAGDVFTISADIKELSQGANQRWGQVSFYDSGDIALARYDAWDSGMSEQRLSFTTPPAPAGTVKARVYWNSRGSGYSYQGKNFQIEKKPFATSFVDGTRPGGNLAYDTREIGITPEGDWTILGWYKKNAKQSVDNSWAALFQMGNYYQEGESEFQIWTNHHGDFKAFSHQNRIERQKILFTPNDDELIEWFFVGVTRQGDSMRFYIHTRDREIVDSWTLSHDLPIAPRLRIGGQWAFNGLIDELLILPYAATEEEIKTWYNSGTPFFDPLEIATAELAARQYAEARANEAKTIAINAQSAADTANALLADIASDSKLTPDEKQATKKEWDIIVGEKPVIEAQAATYGITTETTAYTTAYNALNTYITPLLQNLTTTSSITGSTFRSKFKDYYDAKTALLKKISDVAYALTQEDIDAEKRPVYVKGAGANIDIDKYGIRATRKADSKKTFEIDAETGDAYFRGDITGASGTFSGNLSAEKIMAGIMAAGGITAEYIKTGTLTYDTMNVVFAAINNASWMHVSGSAPITIDTIATTQDEWNIIRIDFSNFYEGVLQIRHNVLSILLGVAEMGIGSSKTSWVNIGFKLAEGVIYYYDFDIYIAALEKHSTIIRLEPQHPPFSGTRYIFLKRHAIS